MDKPKLYWGRCLELLGMFLTFGWAISEGSWEPWVAFSLTTGALIFSEYKIYSHISQMESVTKTLHPEDQVLFNKFRELFPSDKGFITFIKNHDMAGGSFALTIFDPLDEFIYHWNNAEHEFIDLDLEDIRSKLLSLCNEYSGLITSNIFPTSNAGQLSIPSDWAWKDTAKFDRAVEGLHSKANEIIDEHSRLIRIGRRRLNREDSE